MRTKFFLTVLMILLCIKISFTQINWQPIGPGAGSDLKSIAIQPDNPDVVYIAGDIEGIFKTTNGGQSWKIINNNLAAEPYSADVYWIQEIVIDPIDFQKIYICSNVGVFVSHNGGTSWQRLLPATLSSLSDYILTSTLAIDPSDSQILYVGTGNTFQNYEGKGKLYKSTNGGNDWFEVTVQGMSDTAVIHNIVIDPTSSPTNRTIIISTNNGVFRTTNNGANWSSANAGLTNSFARRLRGVVSNSNLILYMTLVTTGDGAIPTSFKGGIFKSTNKGDSWIDITGDLPRHDASLDALYDYWKFTLHPTNPNIIYIGTTRHTAFEEAGVYKSTAGGNTWEKIDTAYTYGWLDSNFYKEENVFLLEVAPSNPNILYSGLIWMHRSTDAGDSWHQIYSSEISNGYWKGNGLELMNTDAICFHPTNPNKIYVGYDDMGFFRSEDGLNSLTPMDPNQNYYGEYDGVKDIWIDPQNFDLYKSRFGGSMGAFNGGYAEGRIYHSNSDGSIWSNRYNGLPDGRPDLAIDFISGSPGSRYLYCASYNNGFYKSTNSGTNWTPMNNGLGSDAAKVWNTAIDPAQPNTLYLGINSIGQNSGGIYKSVNGGQNWTKLTSFPTNDIMKIKINQLNGNIYACATDNFGWSEQGGLFVSTDGGGSWIKIFNQPRVADVDFHPADAQKIFVVSQQWYNYLPTLERAVFYTSDGGTNWINMRKNLGHTFINFVKVNPHNPDEIFVGTGGGGLWKGVIDFTDVKDEQVVDGFMLHQNYPNPFNPSTKIKYAISSRQYATLKIFDVLGNEVATLVNEEKLAGVYEVEFDASSFPSGVYFYQLRVADYLESKKMILIR